MKIPILFGIWLTEATTKKPVMVNIQNYSYMKRKGVVTTISVGSGFLLVTESPDEIEQMLTESLQARLGELAEVEGAQSAPAKKSRKK